MQKILIVEDDKKLSKELEKFLSQNGYEISRITSFENIINDILNSKCNMVLLDINLPGNNGEYICKEVRKISEVPIVMITSVDSELDQLISLNYGADDYITKPFNPLELLARVKSMMRRYTSLGSIAEKNNVIRIGDVELDKDAKEVRVNGKLVKMTATEYGILQLLMENAGKVFSIDEIYERVWNESSFSPENTVSVHIRRIREKIEINPKEPRYLKVVWGIGYKIEKI